MKKLPPKKIKVRKTITITVLEFDDKSASVDRVISGFNILELIGLFESEKQFQLMQINKKAILAG